MEDYTGVWLSEDQLVVLFKIKLVTDKAKLTEKKNDEFTLVQGRRNYKQGKHVSKRLPALLKSRRRTTGRSGRWKVGWVKSIRTRRRG